MNLNIGSVIYELRKKKGITQEQLANVIGVSVPAISKWENGSSYPDITTLPIIARYFNISIDELLSYDMNLSEKELEDFMIACQEKMNPETFDDMMAECEDYLRQYPNSHDLKLSVGSLYMMGLSYQLDEESMKSLAQKAVAILEVASESSNVKMQERSYFLLSSLYGMLEQEDKAEETILKIPKSELNRDDLLTPIYVRQGKYEEAKKLLQTNLFTQIQSIQLQLSNFQNIARKENQPELAEKLYLMAGQLTELFELQSIYHFSHQLGGAALYAALNDKEKTLHYLNEFIHHFESHQPNTLKSTLFEYVDYHETESISHLVPLLLKSLEVDPNYDFIKEDERFKALIQRLEQLQ